MSTSTRETGDLIVTQTPAAARPAAARRAPRILDKILALDDFEEPARRYLPRPIFGYVISGAERHASMRYNERAYDDLAFVPRVLVNTSTRSQKTTLFATSTWCVM